ncbi:MAG TPA: type I-E CRISPR-associated protein Cas6/Cse3/CasE [Geminicoccaceae bacterium]
MTLHLVRLPLNMRALATFAVANGASDDDGGYALHLALRRRFGEAGPQPFHLNTDGPAEPHLLGYATDADALAEAAGLPAVDDLLDPVFAGPPQLRAMPDGWREGARYAFQVRVRPVIRFGTRARAARADRADAWQKRAGEVDAFVIAAERAGEGVPVDREAVYRDWLAERLTPAAELESAELRLLRRVRTRRSRHGKPGLGRVEGPDAVMAGTLAVRDPAAFAALLARGVGRHTAFGFGMLLLSPPGRTG